MRKYRDVVLDAAGNAVNQAAVSVVLAADESPAVLYADADGESPYESNQVLTDAYGAFEFYVADGLYNITAVKGSTVVVNASVEIVETLAFASQIAAILPFLHYLQGTTNQVIITPDENGDLTASLPQSIATTSDPQFRDLLIRRLAGSGTPPSVAYGNGAGGSGVPAAATLSGSGLVFQLDLTPGAAPTAPFAQIATFTFEAPMTAAPIVLLLPMNRATWALHASVLPPAVLANNAACAIQNITVNGFTLNAGTLALVAGTAYSWAFVVVGR